ncbi:helix-turn-helix domain-containing protein, partial [Limosilactobacillus mucosae]|uniref:helix-turn-helix domain-containing protein n=1 Tax=Limosilactobacillus mucosae TaxID=97478 RepID=UPI0022DF2FBF
MKSMAQLEYHYGLKIRIYPSDYQKQIIKVNSDASRFVYNDMSNHFQFLEDKRIDSLAKANAIQNYHKAWNAFRKVHEAGVPKFHRKSYAWRYQTNCQYP